jgi:hypothetical protein
MQLVGRHKNEHLLTHYLFDDFNFLIQATCLSMMNPLQESEIWLLKY